MRTEKIMYLFILMLMLHIGKVHGRGGLGRIAANEMRESAETFLPLTNVALGTYSRSLSISRLQRQIRGDDAMEIAEDYGTQVAVLSLLDLGQGVLLPTIDTIIDNIHFSNDFKNTRDALQLGDDAIQATLGEFGRELRANKKFGEAAKKASNALYLRKQKVLVSFAQDVDSIKDLTRTAKFMRHLKGVKWMFRVKLASKVLGPVFDIINIGISSRGLHNAIKSCDEAKAAGNPEGCNYNAMASSTLCILSGIFGLASFSTALFPPVSAFFGIVSLLLGITSTIIDLVTYKPEVNRKGIKFQKLAKLMLEFDYHSRMQLEESSRYLRTPELKDSDLYVINQGHFPNWMDTNDTDTEIVPTLSGVIKFGYGEGASYNKYGRLKETIELKGFNCSSINVRAPTASPTSAPVDTDNVCSYNQEGKTDNDMKLTTVLTDHNVYSLGPSFYGLTRDWRDGHEGINSAMKRKDLNSEYKGTVIMVNTNHVNEFELTESLRELSGYAPQTHNTSQKLRGLDIDTEKKIVDPMITAAYKRNNFNDVVNLGDMRNKLRTERGKIKINTGSGRDALNIDGWVEQLDADLGNGGHNTLSFSGMSEKATKQRTADMTYANMVATKDKDLNTINCVNKVDMYYGKQIRGVKFNPETGVVLFVIQRYDSCSGNYIPSTRRLHRVGTVKGVGILNGSPFDFDVYTLYALGKDESNPDVHYSVFKFKGGATYVFDADKYKNRRVWRSRNTEVIKFKIVDGTKDRIEIIDRGPDQDVCQTTRPKLLIKNLPYNAKRNNILFMKNKIHIYKDRDELGSGLIATISFITVCPCEIEATRKTSRGSSDNVELFKGLVADLDTLEYLGNRIEHKFDVDRIRSEEEKEKNDIAYLQCPASATRIKSTIRSVSTIILNNKFFDDCDIDDDKVSVTVSSQGDLTFEFKEVEKFTSEGETQEIQNYDRIVNEYGVDILGSLPDSTTTFDLFKQYNIVRGECVVDQSQTKEREGLSVENPMQVWNNLQACIKRAELKKQNEMYTGKIGDFEEAELQELCDTP